ncbi:MAG: Spo0B domain-containing protein [Planctomycetes bacterium]|nr:Spo0B domain-containing protein [Planctomycetota bacterium]
MASDSLSRRMARPRKRAMKLQTRVMLWIACILLISTTVVLALNLATTLSRSGAALERNLATIAQRVATLPEVVSGLAGSPFDGIVQNRIQQVLDTSPEVDQIMVCDMDGTRFSHSNLFLLGLRFEGGEAEAVVKNGRSYVTTSDSEHGEFMRAFAPVFSGSSQVGFVAAGAVATRIRGENREAVLSALSYLLAGLAIGLIGAYGLARKIKAMLLGMEPQDLAQLYREHTGMVEALHEGVVAINEDGRISMANESARKLLGRAVLFGEPIDKVMPGTLLPEVIATGGARFENEERVNGRIIITNIVPVVEKGRVVGAVETFQDKTQVMRMAEELTGIRQQVQALRASSHEFSNKLHAILGMIELQEYDDAKAFIHSTQQNHGALDKQLINTFRDPMIAGLMLGKFSVAAEQGVSLAIAAGSRLEKIDDAAVSHALVSIIGNLVDNAFDAVRKNAGVGGGRGDIVVDIRENDGIIAIKVRDNGPGIKTCHRDSIFMRGFSTKGEGRGTGLYLVRQEVRNLGGDIAVESKPGSTEFTVTVPSQRGENA